MSVKSISMATWAKVCLLVCLVSTFAFAGMVELGYRQLRGDTPAAVSAQSAISYIQSASWASPINPVKTNGNQKIAAFVKGTTMAGTATLAVGLYHKDSNGNYHFLGLSKVQQITMAAGTAAQEAAAGTFCGTTDLDCDTRAAAYYDLRVTQLTVGSAVTVIHFPYGAGPRPGE